MDNEIIQSIELLHILDNKYTNKYERMGRNQLIKEILIRDNAIQELKENIRVKNEMEDEKIHMYKNKLGQEIQQNEKVVSGFAAITEVIADIINKLTPEEDGQVSRSTIMTKIRQSYGQPCEKNLEQSIDQQLNQSSFSCFDQIINDTFKLLEYLSKLVNELKDRENSSRDTFRDTLGMKSTENFNLREENRMLENLLKKTQVEKNQLMKNIFDSKTKKDISMQIDAMDREQLIQMIQKQRFEIKELKKDKRAIASRNQKQRQTDYRKYEELLFEVKSLKNRRSHAVSMGLI